MNLIRQTIATAVALLCGFAVVFGAEPAAAPAKRPQPERWLLILDTSAKMERRAKAVEGMVSDLLNSGMNGQMSPGSELGIWTYNKQLYAGVAPLQTWDPARSNIIAGRSVEFLSRQTYRDKGRSELVMAELADIVRSSRQLTIVWLSEGSQSLTNTPFDDAINTAYAKYRPTLAKSRMPLVTVLRVHHGKYFAQNVSVAPWPIEFPPFPVEEKTNAPAKPAATTPKPEPVKSIFISAPKKPAAEPAPVPPPAPSNVQLVVTPEPPPLATNAVVTVKPVEIIEPKPAASAPPPAPVEPPPAPIQSKPEAKPVEVAPATPASPPPITPAPEAAITKPISSAPQAASAGETVTARKWPLILGIGFMWVAIITSVVLARRARRANATSLITRSLEQKRK